jgi:hypothetical protein
LQEENCIFVQVLTLRGVESHLATFNKPTRLNQIKTEMGNDQSRLLKYGICDGATPRSGSLRASWAEISPLIKQIESSIAMLGIEKILIVC